jgi:hypothetical protein
MTAQVLRMQPATTRLECSKCGASGEGSCACHAPYVAAGTRAAAAVKANPGKSDRVLAGETGVSRETVRKARTGDNQLSPEKRTGKDGKKYPAKSKASPKPSLRASDPIQEDCTDCDTLEQYWQRSLGNLAGDAISMRSFWTREFGKWQKFEAPSSLVTLAKQAAKVWTELAAELAKQEFPNG